MPQGEGRATAFGREGLTTRLTENWDTLSDDPTDTGSLAKASLGGTVGLVKGVKARKEALNAQQLERTADREQRMMQLRNKREVDRAARRKKLEFNIGDDSLISQNPQTNGTGGGNATFASQGFNTMSAVSDPNINTAGSLFSKPVPPPMDDIQKSKQQQITPVT